LNGTKLKTSRIKRSTASLFKEAQFAFSDSNRIIAKDLGHSESEERYYCFGKIAQNVVTYSFYFKK
jgi:hypothetical protein